MAVHLREIHLKRLHRLPLFEGVDHLGDELERIRRLGREVAASLGRGRVWMLNSTASGGGVAEMMPTLVDLLREVGIDARWLVLECDEPEFFRTTKALHNMLHGAGGRLDAPAARAVYNHVSRDAAAELRHVGHGDILIIHDPQPAGIAAHLRQEQRPHLIWRCHIGTHERTEATQAAWDFLAEYLAPYDRCIFSAEPYIPAQLAPRSGIIYPGIDPLSHKNRFLRPYKLAGILRAAALVEGPPIPDWARFPAPALRYLRGGWEPSPVPGLFYAPMMLQVSRFDSLKGFQHLMPAFSRLAEIATERALRHRGNPARATWELEHSQLVLAGPDPTGVADDPEANEMLGRLCAQHDALPPPIRDRVHLLRLPMVDAKSNALIVNALQRIASLVVQLSVKEGFGLTVTEAMWKRTPVVASNVGGLAIQIRHGVDGLLVDDPEDATAVAERMIEATCAAGESEVRARSAKTRVHDHFLILGQVERWLNEIQRAFPEKRNPAEAGSR